jgi:ribosomal protein S15P/S13E
MADALLDNNLPYGNKFQRYKTLKEWTDAEKAAGYDLEGYIAKHGIPDQSKGQHLTDEFKLPNHITFSTDSKYSTPETPGGKWEQGENKKWAYTPSDHVIKTHGANKLKEYFKNNEPDSDLRLP